MVKTAIVTLFHGSSNYGGILQAFALQKVVASINENLSCELLNYKANQQSFKERISFAIQSRGLLTAATEIISRQITQKATANLYANNISSRNMIFRSFRDTMPQSPIIYTDANIADALDRYGLFICGSDVVWGSQTGKLAPVYWLAFVPPSIPKIAYAPSMGSINDTQVNREKIKQFLSDFDAISVREESGCQYLADLMHNTGKTVTRVLDPTFLLSLGQWDDFCENRDVGSKYILSYLIGYNRDQRRSIIAFSKKTGLPIVSLPFNSGKYSYADARFGDYRLFDVSPPEFVGLIKNAEYVFTDSFHGTIFANIYHKDHYVYKRYKQHTHDSMNQRVYNLLDMLGTRDRLVDDTANADQLLSLLPINYTAMELSLSKPRGESLMFLKHSLSASMARILSSA